MLRGIDIASHQEGINIYNLTDVDFIVVKATGGYNYNNPFFNTFCDDTLNSGKLLGCYHYAAERTGQGSAESEAEHFLNSFRPYIGKAIPMLDWENDALFYPVEWAKTWLDIVARETNSTPFIYMSKSVCREKDWSSVASSYPVWVAQYANYDLTGWQDDPWTDDYGCGAWDGPTIFQYTRNGRIDGWDKDLDLDLYYGSKEQWQSYCTTSQPSGGNNVTSCSEIAAIIHADMCNDESNGYDWGCRWGGDNWGWKTLNIDGKEYSYNTGSYDCASSVITAWSLAIQYTAYAGSLSGATYTGNMRDVFVGSGLFDVWDTNSTEAYRGDIYLNDEAHTAICQDGGQGGWDSLSEFSMGESGDVYGNQPGDQTGYESHITGFYNYPWWCTLHYNGAADDSQGSSEGDAYIPPQVNVDIPYIAFKVKTIDNGWLGEGREGDGSAIIGIAINFEGHGWYEVCTEKDGWIERVNGYDINDDENGYAGYNDSPIIAVRAYYETPNPSATGYFSAKYRVSNMGQDYWPWQYDNDTWNGQDGYAGDMKKIDRFYIELSS